MVEEELTEFQTFLQDAYFDYIDKHRQRKVSDTQFAKFLGVSVASYNAWVNGVRKPDFYNAVELADKLGPKVFDLLDYERISVSSDPRVGYIIDAWRFLDESTRTEIEEAVREELSKSAERAGIRG